MIDQTLDSALEAGIRPLATGTPWRALIGKISRVPFWGLLLLTAGCASTTSSSRTSIRLQSISRQRMPRRLARQQSREAS